MHNSAPEPPLRLHLAASRLERLPPAVTSVICQPGWVHLGEPPVDWGSEVRESWRCGNRAQALRLAAAWLYRAFRPRYTPEQLERLYAAGEFQLFHFSAGDRLEFPDGACSFVFSEHFFEHLFLPESLALLRECHRVMRPGAVIRTSVPDADLRTYAAPEPAGFPARATPWTHHQKHKSRWNVYSLSAALELAGFRSRPVLYCTAAGEFCEKLPAAGDPDYAGSPDRDLIGTLGYLRRLPSLVVDGIKPPDASETTAS